MSGAPFLIARGRRRGYSTLLAPGWLLAANDHGFLEEAVGPVDEPLAWRSTVAVSPGGRRVALVWAEHAVSAVEVGLGARGSGGAGGSAGGGAGGGVLRDEHSRPLRLLYGFVSLDAAVAAVGDVAAVDLDRSRAAAIGTYRRFLADEERFTVEASAPFELATVVSGVSVVSRVSAATFAGAPAFSTGPVPGSVPMTGPPVPVKAPKSRPVVPLVAGAAAVATLLLAGGIWLSAGSGDPPPPSCEPTATSSAPVSGPVSAPASAPPDGKPTLPPCR